MSSTNIPQAIPKYIIPSTTIKMPAVIGFKNERIRNAIKDKIAIRKV